MEQSDRKTFAIMFNQLLAYYPEANINTNLVLDGYFDDLSHLAIEQVGMVFSEARRTCRFFPKIPELLEIERTLRQQARRIPACRRCPSGHGTHEGHHVSHYPAGPWCNTCNADIPVPAGYLDTPPPAVLPKLLEERTPELSVDEVRHVIEKTTTAFDKRTEQITRDAEWKPITDERMIQERRAALRKQADALRDGMNEELRNQGKATL